MNESLISSDYNFVTDVADVCFLSQPVVEEVIHLINPPPFSIVFFMKINQINGCECSEIILSDDLECWCLEVPLS